MAHAFRFGFACNEDCSPSANQTQSSFALQDMLRAIRFRFFFASATGDFALRIHEPRHEGMLWESVRFHLTDRNPGASVPHLAEAARESRA